MAEERTPIARFSQELRETSQQLQMASRELQGALAEQRYFREGIEELRVAVRTINTYISGETGLFLRMKVLEDRVATMDHAQKTGRDWWFRLLGSLAVIAIVGVAVAFVALYVGSKGGVMKP